MKKKSKISSVIVIGGSDPSGGAGIQADLQVLNYLQIKSYSVITAITAQNDKKFLRWESVSLKLFKEQLDSLDTFASTSVIKIGMIGESKLIPLLKKWLQQHRPPFVILDPVLSSSTGKVLWKGNLDSLKNLFPFLNLLTPNLKEAEKLTQVSIHSFEEMKKSCLSLSYQKVESVLLKGGHFNGNPIDLLYHQKEFKHWTQERIPKEVHGTGCTLASAIAGYIAKGDALKSAIQKARKIVLRKILEA
ncbi:MAG: hydroxymethylpyrimidine/phosphomethylpyrimidine kinase [Deltaproteobacteria bacterium]|nr:hydroxymethylpyrimidine/phosphomethylpyrimidine kinase [Deltaproteobacteria bacterium]